MIGIVVADNLTGVNIRQLKRRIAITGGDLVLQAAVIVLGLVLAFHPHRLSETIHLGTAPSWSDLAFALPITVIAFTGLEAAASIAGEVAASRPPGEATGASGLGDHRADLRRDRVRRDLGAARA